MSPIGDVGARSGYEALPQTDDDIAADAARTDTQLETPEADAAAATQSEPEGIDASQAGPLPPSLDGALAADLVAGAADPARLLAQAPTSKGDLAAGASKLGPAELGAVSKEIAGLEEKVAALAAKQGGIPAAAPVRTEADTKTSSTKDSRSTGSASQSSSSSASSSAGGASAAGGSSGAGGAGAAGGSSASSGVSIQAQDEQGGASRAYTRNIAETQTVGGPATAAERVADIAATQALTSTAIDQGRGYAERMGAAIDLAERAVQALDVERATVEKK